MNVGEAVLAVSLVANVLLAYTVYAQDRDYKKAIRGIYKVILKEKMNE